jgi:hypothetical protein
MDIDHFSSTQNKDRGSIICNITETWMCNQEETHQQVSPKVIYFNIERETDRERGPHAE